MILWGLLTIVGLLTAGLVAAFAREWRAGARRQQEWQSHGRPRANVTASAPRQREAAEERAPEAA
jgi:hypothetical protein